VGDVRAGRSFAASGCAVGVAAVLVAAGTASAPLARWQPLLKVPTIVDAVGPRADGRLVLATRGGLFLLRPGRAAEPFARGPDPYVAAGGEPYIALASNRKLPQARCSFKQDDVFALDADTAPGVVRVTRAGRATRFADLPANVLASGIAFDHVGRFGSRLLVTTVANDKTTLYAFDCLGRPAVIAKDAPRAEGGMAVAPRSFGRFGGELIAADEFSGRILAFGPSGGVRVVAASGVRAGSDLGVEGVGFVPKGFGKSGAAYFSDLGAPGSPTEGTDSLLVLRGADALRAGLRAGDLVAATEAGATTIAVRCARRCSVRHVADGPKETHGEGHVTLVSGR
jgi:hypothetical protein